MIKKAVCPLLLEDCGFYKSATLDTEDYTPDVVACVEYDKANVIGSIKATDLNNSPKETHHKLILDIDYGAQLIPSRTPGHFHLVLDHWLTEWEYRTLLWVLCKLGIIQWNWARQLDEYGMTFIRKPR